MQTTKIGDYFSPTATRRGKRQRPLSSPESPGNNPDNLNMGDKKVGDMPLTQLMAGLSNLLENKLDEKLAKLATKDDLAGINSKVQEIAAENEVLRNEIRSLKLQGKLVHDKLIDLESRSRRNNLIFKGLNWKGNRPDFKEVVRNFIKEVLGNDRVWINRAHPIGRDGKAIIAHIPEDADISYILMHARNLKGTGYIVHRDFPQEIRVKRSYLVAVRSEIDRVAGGLRMPLFHDHLYVKGKRFTWEDGQLKVGREDGAQVLATLFRHDFTEFLAALPRRNLTDNNEPQMTTASQTFAQAASQKTTKISQMTSQSASNRTPPATTSGPGQTSDETRTQTQITDAATTARTEV